MSESIVQFTLLVQDATLKAFWYKRSLRRFLRTCRMPESLFRYCDERTKREWLDDIFQELERSENGLAAIQRMAQQLREMDSFPDLSRHEDSEFHQERARDAISALGRYMARKEKERDEKREALRIRRRADEQRARAVRRAGNLEDVKQALYRLTARQGTQEGGYDFQCWFYDQFLAHWETTSRKPYVHDGRQMDGSVSIDGVNYVVELKFTSGQAKVTDIDSLKAKVGKMSDNTMGLFISMGGYTTNARSDASGSRTTLLLLDYSHISLSLDAGMPFDDVVRRIARHASQTGEAFLPTDRFGG